MAAASGLTLRELAALVGGALEGDGAVRVARVAELEAAGPGEIAFLANPRYEKFLATTRASAVIVHAQQSVPRADIALLRVTDPYLAFTIVQRAFAPPPPAVPAGVHPTAVVDPTAVIDPGAGVGPLCVVGAGATLGAGAMLFPRVVLGANVRVGADTRLYPGVVVYDGCSIGARVTIHAGAVIGADGFGFAPNQRGGYDKIPQTGTVVIEDDVEIGANCTIDRAAIGQTWIRRGAKIDNLVMIAHNVEVGEDTVIVAQAGVAGSARLGRHVTLAAQSGVTGHVELGDNVIVSAQSGVSKSLAAPGLYMGSPAREYHLTLKTEALLRQLPDIVRATRELVARVEQLAAQLEHSPSRS